MPYTNRQSTRQMLSNCIGYNDLTGKKELNMIDLLTINRFSFGKFNKGCSPDPGKFNCFLSKVSKFEFGNMNRH